MSDDFQSARGSELPTDTSPGKPRNSRRRWPWVVGIGLAIFVLPQFRGDRGDVIGGNWVIVWKHSSFPGTSSRPMLHRRKSFGTREVDKFVWFSHYIGDDCVLYITDVTVPPELRAACGEQPPITVSGRGSGLDWEFHHPDFSSDPIPVGESTFVSVAEVKRRAGFISK